MKEVYVPIGTREHINGFEINIQSRGLQKRKRTIPGSTARHEAIHAVVAEARGTSVRRATGRPGPGYKGLTELSGYDPVAAAAPAADGCDGTGHDLAIVELSGASVSGAISAAKSVIAERREEINEVAAEIEEQGTVDGSDIRAAMKRVGEGEEVIVEIKSPFGERERITQRGIKGEIVMIPGQLFDLSRAA